MRAYLILDGQWGSTGKGLFCGYISKRWEPDCVACNFGPNAGHTYMADHEHDKLVFKQLPTAIVSPSIRRVLIGPGSIIDPDILASELAKYQYLLRGKDVYIHAGAAVVTPAHKSIEKRTLYKISSTQKGTGAALASKIMRRPDAVARYAPGMRRLAQYVVDNDAYMEALLGSDLVQIESAQGLELSVGVGSHYPYTTSRDITPMQVLADTLVHPKYLSSIIATMRTFPIRVGDQFSKGGKKVGTSGPVYPDQREITFPDLGVPDERTTVTGKIRRVFTWSNLNLKKVLQVICPDAIFLNFANYLHTEQDVRWLVDNINRKAGTKVVRWIGRGPYEEDVHVVDYNDKGEVCLDIKPGGVDPKKWAQYPFPKP